MFMLIVFDQTSREVCFYIIVTRRLDGPRAAGFDRWGLLSIVTTDGWLTTSPRRFSHVLLFNDD